VTAVVVPEDAGLLSARGLGSAVVERFAQRQVLAPLAGMGAGLAALLAELAAEARAAVAGEGVDESEVEIRRRILHLRFEGQDATIPVEVEEGAEGIEPVRAGFDRAYRARYGYRPERREIEVESVRVVASSRGETEPPVPEPSEPFVARPVEPAGPSSGLPVFQRSELAPGARLAGPALIFEPHSATVVAAGWSCRMDGAGALVLERRSSEPPLHPDIKP